jgi:hypothetical protein
VSTCRFERTGCDTFHDTERPGTRKVFRCPCVQPSNRNLVGSRPNNATWRGDHFRCLCDWLAYTFSNGKRSAESSCTSASSCASAASLLFTTSVRWDTLYFYERVVSTFVRYFPGLPVWPTSSSAIGTTSIKLLNDEIKIDPVPRAHSHSSLHNS